MTTTYQQFDSTFHDPFAPQMNKTSAYNTAIVPYDETQLQKQPAPVPPPPSMVNSSPRYSEYTTAVVPYNPQNTALSKSHPLRKKMKKQRQRRTAGAAVGGTIVGGIILGPLGMVVGGAGAAAATRKICKAGEKRKVRKMEQQLVQDEASDSRRGIRHASFA